MEEKDMYTFDKQLHTSLEAAVAHTKDALAANGFGILTEIDIQKTMKTKLGADMLGYIILGACNPKMAFEALRLEPRVGAMLPCNVIIREQDNGAVEVSAIDPLASMRAIENKELHIVAEKVRTMLQEVIQEL
jgi:uncharacterized protein (DUF302 family)